MRYLATRIAVKLLLLVALPAAADLTCSSFNGVIESGQIRLSCVGTVVVVPPPTVTCVPPLVWRGDRCDCPIGMTLTAGACVAPPPVTTPSCPGPASIGGIATCPGEERVGPHGCPLDAAGREACPGGGVADTSGSNLWRGGSFWRLQLETGQAASRGFTVPIGWSGHAEYTGDNAALQGDFAVYLDGDRLVGAGQELRLAPGAHTLSVEAIRSGFANLQLFHQ